MANTITQDDLGQDQQSQQNQQNQGGAQQAGNSGATSNNQQSSGGYQQQTGQPAQQQSTIQSYNPNKQQGSGYTNIQKVLQANQGNKLGQAIGSGIAGQAQQGQQQLGQSQQNFNQQTQQNQANTDANGQLVTNVLSNADQYAPTGGNDANAQAAAKFQQLISGQYAGPTQLGNATQLQNQASDVGQLAQATGNAAGQVGLLQRFVGNPQYTTGQQNLDQVLLGQNKSPDVAAARRQALQLQSQVGGALSGAQAVGQQQSNQAQAFGQDVQSKLGDTVTAQDTALQSQATQAQAARDTQYQKAISDLQSGNITQDEADLLGLSQGQQVTQNALQNASQFFTENPDKASAQNVASAQDYAKLNALKQLSGQYGPQAAQDIFGQYQDPTQAGKFASEQAIQADTSGFNNANQAQIANYQSIVNPAYQKYADAQQILALENTRNKQGGTAADAAASAAAAQQLAQKYSGALGGSTGQQTAWAQANQDSAQKAYIAALAQANGAVGGLTNINITPQQAALQQIAQSQGNS